MQKCKNLILTICLCLLSVLAFGRPNAKSSSAAIKTADEIIPIGSYDADRKIPLNSMYQLVSEDTPWGDSDKWKTHIKTVVKGVYKKLPMFAHSFMKGFDGLYLYFIDLDEGHELVLVGKDGHPIKGARVGLVVQVGPDLYFDLKKWNKLWKKGAKGHPYKRHLFVLFRQLLARDYKLADTRKLDLMTTELLRLAGFYRKDGNFEDKLWKNKSGEELAATLESNGFKKKEEYRAKFTIDRFPKEIITTTKTYYIFQIEDSRYPHDKYERKRERWEFAKNWGDLKKSYKQFLVKTREHPYFTPNEFAQYFYDYETFAKLAKFLMSAPAYRYEVHPKKLVPRTERLDRYRIKKRFGASAMPELDKFAGGKITFLYYMMEEDYEIRTYKISKKYDIALWENRFDLLYLFDKLPDFSK